MRTRVCALAVLVLVALPAPAKQPRQIAVVTGRAAPELERYAAEQLCSYLDKLFAIKVQAATTVPPGADAVFLIGSPVTNPAIARNGFPKLTDQGVILRRTRVHGAAALIAGGGSPAAALWAVAELAERWGVRFLLHGDVLPSPPSEFRLPEIDSVHEPALRVRAWRVVNDFANGPESWGMADYRPVLDQLAKLRFNRILISIWPYQPFLNLKVKGVERKSATLWYGFRLPITPDMIGRNLFGNQDEFWNPDLPRQAPYAELAAAGERLLHNLMAYAHQRGMDCAIAATPTQFPPEFAPLLKSSQKVHQLGEMWIVPGPDTPLEDPALGDLAAAVLRTTVNTYPEADYVALSMPEFRQWVGQYEQAWRGLDAGHGISKVRSLAGILAAARDRRNYPGGPDRAVAEVKGDLAALYFHDRLLNELRVLKDTRRPDMKFIYGGVAEELYPLLERILPSGAEMLHFVDYTPSRIVKRREVLKYVPSRAIPASLIYTLEDDNVGLLPQLTTGSLSELTRDLLRYGWAGFATRYWIVGGQDAAVAYLSRAAWDRATTPEAVFRDQLRAVCGPACVEDMLAVFREVQEVTTSMEWHELGFAFAVPGMMMKHWKAEPMPADLVEDRQAYKRALGAARRARENATPAGRGYVEYWAGRLEFAVDYLNAVEALRHGAIADASKNRAEALSQAEAALAAARRAIEAYARVARDQCDRGAIAQLNEWAYRPLRAKVESLR